MKCEFTLHAGLASSSEGPFLARRAVLKYSESNPYAVTFAVGTYKSKEHGTEWVEWTLSRGLLAYGTSLLKPSQLDALNKEENGDVSVHSDNQYSYIELKSPNGYAVVRLNKVTVQSWLRATYCYVQNGDEFNYMPKWETLNELLELTNNASQ